MMMSSFKTTLLLMCAVVLAYIWAAQPTLNTYAVQAFALSALCFFAIKRMKRAKFWHIMPENNSFEMAFITFGLILLIGSTGNLDSVFFPLGFIHLFFLVLSTSPKTAVAVTTTTVYVHYLLQEQLLPIHISNLVALPVLLVFFIFAKLQYDEARQEKNIITQQANSLELITVKETQIERFITSFLSPKIAILQELVAQSKKEKKNIDIRVLETQLSILDSESAKIITAVTQKMDTDQK